MRLRLVAVRENLVPPEPEPAIARLGTKATEYAQALFKLAEAGNQNADYALTKFIDGAREQEDRSELATVALLVKRDITPVNIDPVVRWRMDKGGIVALQLLLWMWQGRQMAHTYDEQFRSMLRVLPQFDRETCENWWYLARHTLEYFYPVRYHDDFLTSLSGAAARQRWRRIRDTFESFGHPDVKTITS